MSHRPPLHLPSTSCRDSRKCCGHLCLSMASSHDLFKGGCLCFCWNIDLNICPPPPPLLSVVTKDGVYVLDMAAKIDATADYICKAKWGDVEFPPPFGREAYPEVRGGTGERDLAMHQISICQQQIAGVVLQKRKQACWGSSVGCKLSKLPIPSFQITLSM